MGDNSSPDAPHVGEGPAQSKLGFARKLASPNKKIREKAISFLVLWLTSQKQVSENELKRIWKGLFYCVWQSDKLPVQADLIERLASLAEKLDTELSLPFFKVFLSTMRREWGGIDKLRLDKFYLLLSKYLIHMFRVLEISGWDADCIKNFMDAFLDSTFLAKDQYAARGINFHYAEIFLKELAKFLPLKAETLRLLLQPFLVVLTNSSDKCFLEKVRGNIFDQLLDSGRTVLTAKRESNDLDPGIELLGSLAFSFPIASEAFELASAPSTSQLNRKMLYQLHQEFENLEKLLTLSGITFSFSCSKKTTKVPGESGSIEQAKKLKSKRKRAGRNSVQDNGGPAGKKAPSVLDDKTVINQAADDVTERESCAPVKDCGGDMSTEEKPFEKRRKKKVTNSELNLNSRGKKQDSLAGAEVKRKKGKQKTREKAAVVADMDLYEDCTSEGKSSWPRKETNDFSEESRLGLVSREKGPSLNDPVVSNLRKCFDRLASELPNDSKNTSPSPVLSNSAISSLGITGSKKRKRASIIPVRSPKALQENQVLPSSPMIDGSAMGNSTGKAKKVRFSLKNNLEWKPHSPLPPQDLRVPPSATPRGSALKKGVPPGPITVEKILLRQRKGTPRRRLVQSNAKKASPRRSKLQNKYKRNSI